MARQLLRSKPYTITQQGGGMKVVVGALSGFKPGDMVYEEKFDNGIVQLIPKEVFDKNNSPVEPIVKKGKKK